MDFPGRRPWVDPGEIQWFEARVLARCMLERDRVSRYHARLSMKEDLRILPRI